jgi:hypothetical protein
MLALVLLSIERSYSSTKKQGYSRAVGARSSAESIGAGWEGMEAIVSDFET